MNRKSDVCDRNAIDAFLAWESGELKNVQLIEHLAVCSDCREYMEQSAADPQTWTEVTAYLPTSEFDHSSSAEYSAASMEVENSMSRHRVRSSWISLLPPRIHTVLEGLADMKSRALSVSAGWASS